MNRPDTPISSSVNRQLCLDLGITVWIAWLVGPAVDLSVMGLLLGIRFLSQHGYTDAQLARLQRMLRFCGLLTLALNTAGACGHREFGTALVDAVGPALLIGWSETGPWLLRQIHAVCPPAPRAHPDTAKKPEPARAHGLPKLPSRAAGQGPRPGRRAPRGNRQAHLARHSPRPAKNRPGQGQRPSRHGSRRGRRPSRSARRCGIALVDVDDTRQVVAPPGLARPPADFHALLSRAIL